MDPWKRRVNIRNLSFNSSEISNNQHIWIRIEGIFMCMSHNRAFFRPSRHNTNFNISCLTCAAALILSFLYLLSHTQIHTDFIKINGFWNLTCLLFFKKMGLNIEFHSGENVTKWTKIGLKQVKIRFKMALNWQTIDIKRHKKENKRPKK